jgi:hypothetical protein
MPGVWQRGPGVLGCPGPEYGFLLEREAGLALRAVFELHHELAARARPALTGLPHVGVPASAFGVGESAGAGGYRLLDAVQWSACVGGDLPRPRRVRSRRPKRTSPGRRFLP